MSKSDNESEEFYDALDSSYASDEKKVEKNVEKEDNFNFEDDDSDTDELLAKKLDETLDGKFVPLHERLNQMQKEDNSNKNTNSNNSTNDETNFTDKPIDNQENEETTNKSGENVESVDPLYINEEALKEEESTLTEEQLVERHKHSLELKDAGNKYFKESNYNSAIESYTSALRECPLIEIKDRSILYSNRSASFLKLLDTDACIKDCSKSIELDNKYTKPLLRRAECYENTEKYDEALADYKKLCEIEPNVYSHVSKCQKLEQIVKERNEKLKDEMLGKLKELGNMVLKPFGLSTNNFQMVQDPSTGSYSINFKQNNQ